MATHRECAVYECGVRLSQAIALSRVDSSTVSPTVLRNALDRLFRALTALATHQAISADEAKRIIEFMQACWDGYNRLSRHALADNDGYGECPEQLEAIRTMLQGAVQAEPDGQETIRIWFELGLLIARGHCEAPLVPCKQSEAWGPPVSDWAAGNWIVDEGVRLDECLEDIDMARESLLPATTADDDSEPFGDLPETLSGWWKIEQGLKELRARTIRPIHLKPVWNKIEQKLYYDGEVIRTVRVGKAKNIVKVLDSFQELNWRLEIDCPLDAGKSNETIKSLNENLTKIRFHAHPTREQAGGRLSWTPPHAP